jgi:hypothetical protein
VDTLQDEGLLVFMRPIFSANDLNQKAAWSIEGLEQDAGLIYRAMGRKGLESIENVGPKPAEVVEGLIRGDGA